MKNTEELQQEFRKLAMRDKSLAEIVERIDANQISWTRAILHLFLEIAGDAKPAKKATKTVEKG